MKEIIPLLLVASALSVQPSNANWSDPTRPPSFASGVKDLSAEQSPDSAAMQTPEWHLGSVLIDNRRKVAIVNNEVVHEGDSINGARVIDITPGSVRLENASRVIELSLSVAVIKRLVGQ